ncbi:YitT family protein [Shouchella shacheensis]|uniref:YitT family protein n=1 Tax=Shouchella shacheensis TaxID=1649580 RepID=UPI000A4AD2E1|nr:YitT family protein [Shouchella shacheensis]
MSKMIRYVIVLLSGCTLISVGINFFFVSYHLLDGGIIGFGLIAHYVWQVPVGVTIIIVSIPIYVLAWFYFRSFFYNSLAGVIVSSLLIDWLAIFIPETPLLPPLPSAIIGGLLLGIGAGIMFLLDISQGGFDLLAQMIATKTSWNVGVLIVVFDMAAVVAGFPIVTHDEIILSTIAVIATGLATTIITAWGGHSHSPPPPISK